LRGDSGQHEVLSAEDAGVVAEEGGARETVCAGKVLFAIAGDVGTESGEAGEVYIDRPLADNVTARWRAGSFAQPTQEGAHDQETAPQVGNDVGGGGAAAQARGVDAERVPRLPLHGHSEAAQDAGHLFDIADIGDVMQDAIFWDEEGGSHGAHGGVLGAVDRDAAVEGVAALNYESGAPTFQGHSSLVAG